MPWSALPEHLNSPEKVEAAFHDDSQFGTTGFGGLYRWYNKKTKAWFAFSYRCTEWWARWRMYPKVLLAAAGEGFWRFENEISDLHISTDLGWYVLNCDFGDDYLSRIQYFTRWHIAIQWPLMISFHFYPFAKDVPMPDSPHLDLDGKVVFGYFGHFDADKVYWMFTSAYLGRNWK